MKLISPTDSMFLLGESREHPMHVGSLQLFQPPAHAGAEFVREAYEAMLGCTDVQPTFRKHPAFFGPVTNLAWAFDDDIDLEYHFRRSALASPAGYASSWNWFRACMAVCSTGTVRCGKPIWWRG
ncbi:wax ester synthase-like Acyl-CoA acyltransferase domain protein [Mycobacterium xenopi 3993]|nr:wax ester synthase-like Acyl-CoA acyltransferase domain protein [Mycobacterium xenopi 3993]